DFDRDQQYCSEHEMTDRRSQDIACGAQNWSGELAIAIRQKPRTRGGMLPKPDRINMLRA
ncbi:hypothetical protein, partial [Bradyrhizobium sp.]|uniref:hypothetical protein n=1 Tax=Bradyrhizobium sp. TaxID=376 RepID=UPI0025C6EFDE